MVQWKNSQMCILPFHQSTDVEWMLNEFIGKSNNDVCECKFFVYFSLMIESILLSWQYKP